MDNLTWQKHHHVQYYKWCITGSPEGACAGTRPIIDNRLPRVSIGIGCWRVPSTTPQSPRKMNITTYSTFNGAQSSASTTITSLSRQILWILCYLCVCWGGGESSPPLHQILARHNKAKAAVQAIGVVPEPDPSLDLETQTSTVRVIV